MTIKYKFDLDGETFECGYMEDLTHLDNYHDIIYIYCQNNKLTVLPTLPHSLTHLGCSYNKLIMLPTLPISLKYLYCDHNNLAELPTLPNSLRHLDCSYNNLEFIPKFKDRLRLTFKCYIDNPVDTYIQDKCHNNIDIYHRVNEIFSLKLVRWYLDCRENPTFKFCRDRINKEYDTLLNEDTGGIMC